jgi:hypothetical protein
MHITQNQWATMLTRWSDVPNCAEKTLITHLLAGAIVEEIRDSVLYGFAPFKMGFFMRNAGFDMYCKVIGLDAVFVREQIVRAGLFSLDSMEPHRPKPRSCGPYGPRMCKSSTIELQTS